jgi:predicted AlkP superfamily phosphohydrolase/phosphomutase
MIHQGKLPAFEHIRQSGIHCQLQSTIPHSSFPAWTTAITGVNPGSHGIIDFTRRISGQDKLIFLNSTHRGVPTIFDILSQRGRSVASLGIPCTSPPDPVNGIMIGGFDCPVAVSAHRNMVHPPELAGDLFRKFGEYPYGSISEFHITPQWYSIAKKTLLDNINKREKIFHWLWEKQKYDLFWMVFPETDTASHHFWSLHDPKSPRHDPQLSQEFGNTLTEIYERLDRVLQGFMESMTDEHILIIMSDHGFGGAGTTEIYLNLWLRQHGYLRFKSNRMRRKERASITDRILCNLPDKLPQWLFRKGFRWMGSLESRRRFSNIDWDHTLAFSEESNSFPGIWIRQQGRDPAGTVPTSNRERLLQEIQEKLLDWHCPYSGYPVMERVCRREEIYSGPHLSLIPDLILEPALIHGYSQAVSNSIRAATDNPIQRLPEHCYRGGKGIGFSGTHRKDGIFLAYGTGIVSSEIPSMQIADISPSILHFLGEQIPQWMEDNALIAYKSKIEEAV